MRALACLLLSLHAARSHSRRRQEARSSDLLQERDGADRGCREPGRSCLWRPGGLNPRDLLIKDEQIGPRSGLTEEVTAVKGNRLHFGDFGVRETFEDAVPFIELGFRGRFRR